MTKEDAIKEFRNNIDKLKKWSMFEYCFEEFICDIFNDFESRTCESCKYFLDEDKAFGKCLNYCSQTPKFTTIDFGCNKWERKE